MRKIILTIIIVVAAIFVYVNVNADVDAIVIPNAAIRVRVIANSNSIYDQSMKMKVKEYIEKSISPLLIYLKITKVEQSFSLNHISCTNIILQIQLLITRLI